MPKREPAYTADDPLFGLFCHEALKIFNLSSSGPKKRARIDNLVKTVLESVTSVKRALAQLRREKGPRDDDEDFADLRDVQESLNSRDGRLPTAKPRRGADLAKVQAQLNRR